MSKVVVSEMEGGGCDSGLKEKEGLGSLGVSNHDSGWP